MSLFQKSVEKKYLNELDSTLIDTKFAEFQDYFANPERQENIRNSKEEQFQEGFLRELFVKIFGYTLNPEPDFNLTTELKNITNSKKADGAILKGEDALAVIELKGTDTTDLDKIETQAFGYKNHHPKCVYVITSNFEKLRFYIQNAVDHIDFDLFTLTREQFSLLWLCLQKDNLLNDLPLKIKESSVLQEENITKRLYTDYSKFREAIYNNLVKNNPETDKLLLFKKTQKLLDRFLFIFFAEDRLLLPPNSISEIVKQWTTLKDELDEYIPLYSRFKKYFGYMNTGYKGKKYEIYAYNGGLFVPDELLDNISIDDDILHEHTLKLSKYDFETDVDVNILGHIFEHSLGEIENVQAEIKGEKVDSQKTKRKKDGIFYTPKYITKYIVENTVGKLCNEKRKELAIIDEEYAKGRKNRKKDTIKALDTKLTEYRDWLLTLTILDPACGSGAFLNEALYFLITEHRKIDDLRAQLFGGAIIFSDITTDILEKNIYGVDLNEESVEIAKLSLWLRTAQKGRKLNTLSSNIKCGNSLIDSLEVAGEKAFNWQKEFPHIFDNGGFDVVIGNPPYVQIRTSEQLSTSLEQVGFKTYEKMGDLYCLFYEQGFKLLRGKGYLGYITSNSWLNTRYGKPLREFLLENTNTQILIDLGSGVFDTATVDSNILISTKEFSEKVKAKALDLSKAKSLKSLDSYLDAFFTLENLTSDIWLIIDPTLIKLKRKIENNGVPLKDWDVKFFRGVQTGNNDAFIIDENQKQDILDKDAKAVNIIKPLIQGKDISRYCVDFKNKYLIYTNDETDISSFPSINSHLLNFKTSLESKIEVKQGKMIWYSLYRPAKNHIKEFEKIKIVFSKASKEQAFFIDYNKRSFTLNTSFIGTGNDIEYLTLVLNSKLAKYIFLNFYQSGGIAGEITIQAIENIPVPKPKNGIDYAALSKSIHNAYQKVYELRNNFLGTLSDNYNIEKSINKLVDFDKMSFKVLLTFLQKNKIKIPISEQSEWKVFFEDIVKELNQLNIDISQMENSIDQMVYESYGMNEKEIKIVEGTV
ncbi:MAG: N-6 DNA methylase [Bacteroidales bacterium]|nr:N-6 DNA methylase [Bacteroidales bacterium]